MGKRKTNEEFVREVYDLVGDEYTFLEPYKDSTTKIKCLHNKCRHKWEIRPANFLWGQKCSKCYGNVKKTNDEFIKEIYDLVKAEYIFLEKYKNSSTKIQCLHRSCEHKWDVRPNDFLKGTRCPQCEGTSKKSDKQFRKEVYNLTGDNYIFLEEYINSTTPTRCQHMECGYEWRIRPNDFLRNQRCPRCGGNERIDNERFLKEVYDLVGNEYTFKDEYTNRLTKIRCRHNSDKCQNHEYFVSPKAFVNAGRRCPKCKASKGESRVDKFLIENNISFEPQYRIKECRNIFPLPFDFVIKDSLGELLILVEFDGGQHFEPVKHFGGEKGFERTQKNDSIKNAYCKENNIPLLRIPYWDYDNIESILEKELVKHGFDISKKIK